MAHAEVHRSRELDRAARHDRGAACLLLGLVEVGEELHRALVERPAAFGEAHAAGGTVQKARLEMRSSSATWREAAVVESPSFSAAPEKLPGFNDLREHPSA